MSTRALGLSIVLCAGCGTSSAPSAAPVDAGTGSESPAPSGPLVLAPGEVADVPVVEGRAAVTLASAAGTEKFVMILASTKFDASKLDYKYTVAGGVPESASGVAKPVTGCALPSDVWRDKAVAPETGPAGKAPAVGTTRTLTVPVGSRVETITATVSAVSERGVVWLDTTPAHPAVLDAAFTTEFLADFDKTIVPRERAIFGVESDADGDGHVGLVFSPLTKDSAVAFFSQCDLLEVTGCGGAGNKGEYIYLTPPADIAPPYNTPAAIKEVLAHELGHLHHFNRKVLKNNQSAWPDASYMIEGFGAFAQDAVGYQAGNLYVTLAGLDGIGDFSLAEVLGARSTYDTKRDGVLRGGGYLFVRYVYDRAGGDGAKADGTIEARGGTAFLRDVLDAKEGVAQRLATGAGASLADIGTDFFTALALSNGAKGSGTAPVNPCFAYLPTAIDPVTGKQRGADLFASFHGMQMKGPKTQKLDAADGAIRSGGVEYLTFDAQADQAETGVSVTIDAAAAPRVRVARLK